MAVTIITGATRSDSVLQAGLVIDMEEAAARLDDGSYRLNLLTIKMGGGVKTATRMEHKFRERRLMPATATVTSDASAAATTIAVDHPEYFHRDDVVACPATGEVFLMNEDIGGTGTSGSITVINKAGSGGITNAITSGSVLVNLREAHAEGEAIPPAWNVKESEESTYLYQFDQTNQITDVQNAEESYGEKELQKRRMDFIVDQQRALDRMLYLGSNVRETTSASGPRRHIMRGLREWFDPCAIDAAALGGGLTMATLGQLLRPTKAYGASSMTKVGLIGQNAWVSISAFPDGTVQINPGKDQNWGVTLKELNTPFGDLMVSYDPMLSQEYGLAGELYILDPKWVYQLQMNGLPWQMKMNVQDNTDIHNIKDVVTGTRGLVVKFAEELHRRIYNIS